MWRQRTGGVDRRGAKRQVQPKLPATPDATRQGTPRRGGESERSGDELKSGRGKAGEISAMRCRLTETTIGPMQLISPMTVHERPERSTVSEHEGAESRQR